MRFLLILLLAIGIVVGACAQSTTADKPDTRLDQKVTITVSHTKLEDVCKQLTELTGVTIKAGSGERDWKVRERRVTIYAPEMKLGALLQDISKLLGFYLSKSGKEGEWAYLYWQDKKSRDLEAEMLNAEKEAFAQRLTEKRQATLDAAEKALKMTPEEIRKAKQDDPFTAYLAGTKSGRGFAQLLSALATQFPTERDLMLRGKRVTLQFDSLPAYLQQAAIDTAAGGIVAAQARQTGESFPGDLSPYQLVMLPIDQNTEYEAGMLGLSGAIIVNGLGPNGNRNVEGNPFGVGDPMSMFVLTNPDSKAGELIGRTLQEMDDGGNIEEIGRRMNDELSRPETWTEAVANESPTEKEPPTDPKLTREVEIAEDLPAMTISGTPGMGEHMARTLTVISEAIGMPVILESFPRMVLPGSYIRKGKQPLYKALIGLEKAGYAWELSGSALRVRPRDWALRRSYEIPESFIARYKGLLAKRGEFSLDDIAMIAAELTDEQISNTLLADPELSSILTICMHGDAGATRSLLRVYHSLTSPQKTALASDSGLAFADLSGEQWNQLSEVVTDKLGGVYVQDGSIRLSSAPLDEKSMISEDYFVITAMVADQKDPSIVKERITRWRKGQAEAFMKERAEAEQRKPTAEEQQKQAEPAK